MDLGGWLRSLDLEEYEAAFHKNHIDEVVLPNLTAEDLRDLGVGSIGHRRKLLDAIALLRGDVEASGAAAGAPAGTTLFDTEQVTPSQAVTLSRDDVTCRGRDRQRCR